jgi:hypothetical protein
MGKYPPHNTIPGRSLVTEIEICESKLIDLNRSKLTHVDPCHEVTEFQGRKQIIHPTIPLFPFTESRHPSITTFDALKENIASLDTMHPCKR